MLTKIKYRDAGCFEQWKFDLFQDPYSIRPKINKFTVNKEKFLFLIANDKFIDEVNNLRETFSIPPQGFTSEENCIKYLKKVCENEKIKIQYDSSILNILVKFNIHPRWKNAIEYFTFLNNDNIDPIIPSQLDYRTENDGGLLRLKIEIYSDTTLEQVAKEWKNIEKHRNILGYLKKNTGKISFPNNDVLVLDSKNTKSYSIKPTGFKRFKTYKEFNNYKKVYDLRYKQELTYKEISKKMGWVGDYQKVGTYIARFKKALKEASFS